MAADGLERARMQGLSLWRESSEVGDGAAEAGPAHAISAKAFVLADNGCGWACLDAVDVLTAARRRIAEL